MVVSDDHIYTISRCLFHFKSIGDATINAYKESGALHFYMLQGLKAYAVSFIAVRDIGDDLSLQPTEGFRQDGSTTYPITIEITNYEDNFPLAKGTADASYRSIHIRKKERIDQQALIWMKKIPCFMIISHSTVIQELRYDLGIIAYPFPYGGQDLPTMDCHTY
jgi:hypothetical protein